MGLLQKIFGADKAKKYKCIKCGKMFFEHEGAFRMRNKDKFCCMNCCGDQIKKEKEGNTDTCEFC